MWATLGLGGCGMTDPADGVPEAPAATAPSSEAEVVALWVDGVQVAAIDPHEVETRLPLTVHLPEAARSLDAWTELAARSDAGGSLRVPAPAERFDRHTVELYRIGPGRVGLGVFRVLPEATADRPQPVQARPSAFVADVDRIEVWTGDRPPPPRAPEGLATVAGAGRAGVDLSRSVLEATPRVPARSVPAVLPPGLHQREAKRRASAGWSVVAVLAELGIAALPAGVRVDGRGGTRVLSLDALTADPPWVLFMLNQKGQLMLQPTLHAPLDWSRVKGVHHVQVLESTEPVEAAGP